MGLSGSREAGKETLFNRVLLQFPQPLELCPMITVERVKKQN